MADRVPANCRNEPPYSGVTTVVMVLSAPWLTAHTATQLCAIETPHSVSACAEWQKA